LKRALHQQGLDTTTPAGKAMFQMLGVFAEFETLDNSRARSRWLTTAETIALPAPDVVPDGPNNAVEARKRKPGKAPAERLQV
jgi:hypothetical protein